MIESINRSGREWKEFNDVFVAKLTELKGVSDALGHEIENGIKETVATLQLLGFPTTGSCEGHSDWGLPYPWVDIAMPDMPEFEYVGQARTRKRILSDLNATEDDLQGPTMSDEILEKYEIAYGHWLDTHRVRVTEKYKEWAMHNEMMYSRFQGWIEDFDRENTGNGDLHIQSDRFGNFLRICVHDEHVSHDEKDAKRVIQKEIEPSDALASRLLDRQRLMKKFTDFLKMKLQTEGAGAETG